MALFPELGPQYYDEHDHAIKQRMESFYAESISINQAFWSEADTDTRFHVGDQTLWNDMGYGNLPANKRRQFNFNRIRRIVDMISGSQRQQRKSTIVVPVENASSETADQFTKIFEWSNQQESIAETVSEAFEGALITGMNLLQVWVDYRSDPVNGNIKVDNCSYNSFLMDPFFKKPDLSDCNHIWKRSFVTRREAMSLLPGKTDFIVDLQGDYNRDNKFHFLPETYGYGQKNLLTYDEYYYRTYRTQKLLVDSRTGEVLEWKSNNEDGLRAFLQMYPSITVIESEIPTVNLAILVQGKTVFNDRNPIGIDTYPFVPVLGYYHPESPYFPFRIQGVVRGLRDAQYLYNRRKVIELDILESQINSGWVYKENALVNPSDVFLSGQGRGLCLKEDAQMTDVQQIQSPGVQPSVIQLSEILGREMSEISGVSEEMVGSAATDIAGYLSMARSQAGKTTLQGLFDRLDASQKQLGKLMIQIIQSNFTPGKVKKIVGSEASPQFFNKAFGKYDAAVEEGFNTTTQRQMQFAQLLQLKEAGIPVPTEVMLDSCTLQNKSKLVEAIRAQEQQQMQMQQQQMQAQIHETQARAELSKSRAIADQGLGMERLSRIQENRALAIERKAAAVRDENEALLNLIKAVKEYETVDISHVKDLVEMQHLIRQQEHDMEQANKPQPFEGAQ